jgi:hypothetical protein
VQPHCISLFENNENICFFMNLSEAQNRHHWLGLRFRPALLNELQSVEQETGPTRLQYLAAA